MIFTGVDNQTVELKITNYQFPNTSDFGWDGNWLNIYVSVNSKLGHWQTVDPSLTTWEVQELINWFDILSKNLQPEYSNMSFTEPNLSFELLNDLGAGKKIFRIKFDLDLRPKTASVDKGYFVEVVADSFELARISNELKNELSKYPERKPPFNNILS